MEISTLEIITSTVSVICAILCVWVTFFLR